VLQAADKLEHVATEHFWMSGMYWGLTAMELMGRLQQMDTDKILDWVREWPMAWLLGDSSRAAVVEGVWGWLQANVLNWAGSALAVFVVDG
jgi:hypothetical protein